MTNLSAQDRIALALGRSLVQNELLTDQQESLNKKLSDQSATIETQIREITELKAKGPHTPPPSASRPASQKK